MDQPLAITEKDLIRFNVLKSSLFFTRYFFKKNNTRKFVVGRHHELIAAKLDAVLRGEITRLIINISPRYGKTEQAVKNFIANGLALNPGSKYIHLSYSDDLALDNSEGIKDIVNLPEYKELFPEVKIKPGSDSKKKWYTDKGGGVYATAAGGQVTGFGAGLVDDEEKEIDSFLNDIEAKEGFAGALIIDDPIKPDDAESDTVRERINNRYDTTISNRVNSRKTPIILIMQRVHERDLCGYLLENEPDTWEVLSIPCIQQDSEGNDYALWPFKETLEELYRQRKRNPVVFERQKQQNPQPKEGFMYSEFGIYEVIPASQKRIKKAYIDTADLGTDYLCALVYLETEIAVYLLDVYYTQKGMEVTEPQTGLLLTKHGVEYADIESNNGGRGFARNVETQCRLLGNTKTSIHWFHQSQNKDVRIFNKSADVTNIILMPAGWQNLWPEFHKAVTTYSKVKKPGNNTNDDAPDALTGIVENFGKGGGAKFAFNKAKR